MVNQPTFNPNIRNQNIDIKKYRNIAATDYFEPGSVIKAFSMASVLEHKSITAKTMINTSPGYMGTKRWNS